MFNVWRHVPSARCKCHLFFIFMMLLLYCRMMMYDVWCYFVMWWCYTMLYDTLEDMVSLWYKYSLNFKLSCFCRLKCFCATLVAILDMLCSRCFCPIMKFVFKNNATIGTASVMLMRRVFLFIIVKQSYSTSFIHGVLRPNGSCVLTTILI